MQRTDSDGSALRILLVDDHQDAGQLLGRWLDAEGFDVRVAFDPRQALALAESFAPDLAVVDLELPVMDGHELALRLLELGNPILLALTGFGRPDKRERSAAVGFAAHLVKPVMPEDLVLTIRELLRDGHAFSRRQVAAPVS